MKKTRCTRTNRQFGKRHAWCKDDYLFEKISSRFGVKFVRTDKVLSSKIRRRLRRARKLLRESLFSDFADIPVRVYKPTRKDEGGCWSKSQKCVMVSLTNFKKTPSGIPLTKHVAGQIVHEKLHEIDPDEFRAYLSQALFLFEVGVSFRLVKKYLGYAFLPYYKLSEPR